MESLFDIKIGRYLGNTYELLTKSLLSFGIAEKSLLAKKNGVPGGTLYDNVEFVPNVNFL